MKINQHRVASAVGIVGAVALIALVLIWRFDLNSHQPVDVTQPTYQPPAQDSRPHQVEARWLLAGEIFWGRQMERVASSQPEPYKYLFSQLKTLGREQYDGWLGHMECPVTDANISFATQVNDLIFNCRPEHLPEFAKFFNAVSLSNNHAGDVNGVSGLNQTRQNLEKHRVQYYGHFDNSVTSDICEVISLPARLNKGEGQEEKANLPVAMCGYHNVFRLPTEPELDVIERYSERFFTIVSPQQGAEYEAVADSTKVATYRAMIDRGADMVVASHPHWVQNSEVYNGKLIMYSLGNFMFDQEWSEDVKRGVALDISLRIGYDDNLDAWLKLTCAKFKDDCLDQANRQNLKKLQPDMKFDLVSVLHENALTRKAPDAIHQANLRRTNWAKTLETIGQGR